MQKRNLILVFAAVIALSMGVSSMPASGYDAFGPRDPEIASYLEGIETILIDVTWDSSYRYGYPPYDMYAREMDDKDFRWKNETFVKFLYPRGKTGPGSLSEKLLASLKSRLKPELLNRVALKDTRLDDISVHSIDMDKTIVLRFYLGQQKQNLNSHDFLIGGIVGAVDMHPRKRVHSIQQVFLPEPFLLNPEADDTGSLDRALDFAVLQVAEYLNHLSWKYLE